MRILVANANTTEAITAQCAAAARDAASPGVEILAATPRFGPAVIATRVENAIAAHALLELLAEHAGAVQAVVLAVSHDTALEAARQMMPCPVIGMTEAACFAACLLGGRFGLVTLGSVETYRERIAQHGLAGRCATLLGAATTPQEALRDPAHAEALVLEGVRRAAEEGADAVVMGGAALAGFASRLQPAAPVPLLDGIVCAVRMAEMLAGLALPKPRTGSYAAPAWREGSGLSPALSALLRGRAAG